MPGWFSFLSNSEKKTKKKGCPSNPNGSNKHHYHTNKTYKLRRKYPSCTKKKEGYYVYRCDMNLPWIDVVKERECCFCKDKVLDYDSFGFRKDTEEYLMGLEDWKPSNEVQT